MTRPRRFKKRSVFIAAALVLLIVAALDHRLAVTRYTLVDLRLPAAFEGFKVVQVSDLHSAVFGESQSELIQAIEGESPDIIVLTGDIIDRTDTGLEPIEALLEGIWNVAPVYSVSGNHETDNSALYRELKTLYANYGVTVLENSMTEIYKDGARIYIGGIANERYHRLLSGKDTAISGVPPGAFAVLLHHASTQYEEIAALRLNFLYLFAGHTHGGIVRIPFVGGLIDNEMRFFPRYAGGVFNDMEPALISSRGLGNSARIPIPRVNNRPELVSVTFYGIN